MATIFSLPPELLFNIFAMFNSPPPSRGYIGEDYKRYLERNRNLTSFTLVHSTWRYRATEVLQEEVYLYGSTERVASKEEVQRIASLLIDSKVQGTKYLTVDGHLNELLAATGYTMWSQLRFLKLWTSSRNDHTTWMSDFAHFPCESLSLLSAPVILAVARPSHRSARVASRRAHSTTDYLEVRYLRHPP